MNRNRRDGSLRSDEDDTMKCSVRGCPGEYESRKITHTVRSSGRVVVIDGVPAEVCPVCGDVLLRPETVRRIEAILLRAGVPDRTAPVYEYA
jgi:YgiT-type zinc finger domain-containing protein